MLNELKYWYNDFSKIVLLGFMIFPYGNYTVVITAARNILVEKKKTCL